ncbi:ABC transporter family substrate-binding protein [Arthrobacter sp. zg-Y859]|uniref:ABC transporter family substrate-binding protein n=1 Tax=Arthrobacter jinronghuae TaxID=2964609 RepID=A0ABT1NPH8_9MICC|nr:ABC transporter family substrate-binding protein [Arthrobacter jinronghuae]MCQ1949545.1 ABC transporter family substrate-binding protein [Arthrobacter jinronghuae]UWX77688.1 ABC transporter family substrate-binding protein [Arthrobacter jinronghuae]
MRTKRTAALAALSVGALFLGACGSAGGGTESEGGSEETAENIASTINIAISQAPDAYNSSTANTNSTYNSYVDNLVHSNFVEYSPDGVIHDEEFGTFEKTSDDPLTVHYKINEDAKWSDGTPIDFDDVLLNWAAFSGQVGPAEGENIFQPSSTNGFSQTKMIEGEAGDKEFDMVFETPYADWEALMIGPIMPAHVAAEKGNLSPDNDGEELIKAIQDKDVAALTPLADFWNTGWNYEADLTTLPDAEMIPSSGPYMLDNATDGTLTLKRNENYWGEERKGKTETIVFKTIADTEAVQALENGEVDIIEPSGPTVDTKTAIENIGETVEMLTGPELTFSHIDLDQSENGVFKDLAVRQAFAKCVPREDIVEKFAKPIDENATVDNLREYQPGQEDYEEVLEGAPSASDYDEVDIEGAKKLLADAGKTEPVSVRLMFSSTSQLRADIVTLIKTSCDQAGFDIVPTPDPKWSAKLAEPGAWDAILFAWAGSGLAASAQSIYVSDGEQNYGKFTNTELDKLWDQIASSTDEEEVKELKTKAEEILAAEVYNVVLYANSGVVAHSSKLENVELNPSQNGITWNAYKWTKQV